MLANWQRGVRAVRRLISVAIGIVVVGSLAAPAGATPKQGHKSPSPSPSPTSTPAPSPTSSPSPTPTSSPSPTPTPTTSPSPSPSGSSYNPTPGGYDISYPQGAGPYPTAPAFGIVGVSDGLPWSHNPYLASQYAWAPAASYSGFYMNTANPGSASTHWSAPGPHSCNGTSSDPGCAYNYGWNSAADAFAYAQAQTGNAAGRAWWLDVETANSWSTDTYLNAVDLQGSIDYLMSQNVPRVGVYSTASMWTSIAGANQLAYSGGNVPEWLATGASASSAPSYCSTASFTGGVIAIVQYPSNGYDGDYGCGT